MPAIKYINLHNLICREILIFFLVLFFQICRLVVMSRRCSQSVQKSPKLESIRLNALDSLDGLLTILFRTCWVNLNFIQNFFLIPISQASFSYQLFIPTSHTSFLYQLRIVHHSFRTRWVNHNFIQIFFLIPISHTNFSYQLLISNSYTNCSYQLLVPTSRTSFLYQFLVPTSHTNFSYQLLVPTFRTNFSSRSLLLLLYLNSLSKS